MKNHKSKPLVVIQCYEDRQQTLPLRRIEDYNSEKKITNKINLQPKKELNNGPPPPPPMPITSNGHNTEEHKIVNQKLVTKTVIADHNIKNNLTNGTLKRTPTPDYNGKTDYTIHLKNGKDEKAEMESLESYKLKNPVNAPPKPPSHYFVKAPNGTATMKKHTRPVSVTIGEYGIIGGGKKAPSKLDFLNGDKPDGPLIVDNEPITNRLHSELALTLSRSNLRKKTEALNPGVVKKSIINHIVNNDDSEGSLDKNFHARYGVNLLPLPPAVTIPKVSMTKHF